MFYVVSTARIMVDISIVSYHVEYIIFVLLSRFTWLFLVLSQDIKIYHISFKKFITEAEWLYINSNKAVATTVVYILTMSLSMHYHFEQKKYVELTYLNFVTFTVTVTFKALYFNVPTLQGKGHKIRLQGRLKSKVTSWDSIGENAYSLWKHIMQNSNPG